MTYLSKPKIFANFPELLFGFSKKIKKFESDQFSNNMSKSVGDDLDIVQKNREEFFGELGLDSSSVIVQKQIHSDIVNYTDEFSSVLTGDALITKSKNLGLAVSTADCTNIFIYDPVVKAIAAVHSGWAGTEKNILGKTLDILFNELNSSPSNLYVYLGPSISMKNYEVGEEFKDKFNCKYLISSDRKFKLDLKSANLDVLKNAGIDEKHIEVSTICSFEDNNFHSYRRDKNNSGRALGVIALKDPYEQR